MPLIARALKSVFTSAEEQPDQVVDTYTSAPVATKQLLASFQQRLPSGLIDYSSEMYSKASLQLSHLTQDKSQGELYFIAIVLAAVILFVIILPACEAFFPRRTAESKVVSGTKSVPSSSSSTTDSLQTIEESEDEDLAMPTEEDAIIVLAQEGSVQKMQDILNKSVEITEQNRSHISEQCLDFPDNEEEQVYDADEHAEIVDADETGDVVDADPHADDKHSDSTPATADDGLETPTSSPPVTPDYVKPLLTKDYVSAPNVAVQKRSSFGKLGKRLSSTRLGFSRKDSSDASVCSTSSMRKLSLRGFGKKKSLGV